MKQNSLAKFAKYLQDRNNFMKVTGTSFGVLAAIAMLSMFGGYGGIDWWVLLVVLVIPASWLWAYCMWFVCEKDIRRISSKSAGQNANEGTPE